MGLGDWLRDLLGPMSAVSDLARAQRVAALVPTETEYVTVGLVHLLPDAWGFVGGVPGRGPYRYDFGLVPNTNGQPKEVGLLVLASQRLRVIGPTGERWSIEVSQLTNLDGHRHSGFVVLTREPGGIAVGNQSPVEVPPGTSWQTARRVTNVFGGWDKALAPYGVQVHW
jgi:hypothetical protein